MIKSFSDLEIFRLSYEFAMEIFALTRDFPRDERYSLTDQLVRSSRSISANIAEGWGKRGYEKDFKRHLIYAMGSLEETKVWLSFSRDCKYISEDIFNKLSLKCFEISAKVFKLITRWKTN